jgi:hypothetical protein
MVLTMNMPRVISKALAAAFVAMVAACGGSDQPPADVAAGLTDASAAFHTDPYRNDRPRDVIAQAAGDGSSPRDFNVLIGGAIAPLPINVKVGDAIQVGSEGLLASYAVIHWGDGAHTSIPGGLKPSTPDAKKTHVYDRAGTYTLEFATNITSLGGWDSRVLTINVSAGSSDTPPPPPSSVFTRDFSLYVNGAALPSPPTLVAGTSLQVRPASTLAAHSVVNWGDGQTTSIPGGWKGPDPLLHSYASAGNFTVEYATRSPQGAWDSRTMVVAVTTGAGDVPPPPLPTNFSREFALLIDGATLSQPLKASVGQSVRLVPVSDAASQSVIYWGDGFTQSMSGGWRTSTSAALTSHVYAAPGTYRIEYATRSSAGSWDSRVVSISVANLPPTYAQPAFAVTDARRTFINEVSIANFNGARDEDNDIADWVEITNRSSAVVSLSGWGLSNRVDSPFRWVFPQQVQISPGGYLRVWLSKKDRRDALQPLHTSFNLDNGGETLMLTAPNGTGAGLRIDEVALGRQLPDTSWCRLPNATPDAAFLHCAQPTPAAANVAPAYATLLAKPTASLSSGVFAGPQSVTLNGPAGAQLRYTLDGNEPSENSPLYSSDLNISTSTVLRIGSFAPGAAMRSPIETFTYLIGADAVNEFSGKRLVFVAMKELDVDAYVNSHKDKIFKIAVEMVAADGQRQFKADAEGDVGGNIGSFLADTTPLDVSFRDALGVKSVKSTQAIWRDKPDVLTVKKFRLRNGGNDAERAHLRDQLAQSLGSGGPNVNASSSTVAMILNGKYYAMMDLREKEGTSLIESNLSVDNDLMDYIKDGQRVADEPNTPQAAARYAAMVDFCATQDMAINANYQQAKATLDVQSIAFEWALQYYVANVDWPNHNQHMWRSPDYDGLWRWRPHDMDAALGMPIFGQPPAIDVNMYGTLGSLGSEIVNGLMANAEFRAMFIQTVADLFNSSVRPDLFNLRLDAMTAEMQPYIPMYFSQYALGDLATWQGHVNDIRAFVAAREAFHDAHTRAQFNLSERVPLNIGINNVAGGVVKVNSLSIDGANAPSGTWSGRYYPGVELSIQATPKPGYVFSGWQDASSSSNRHLNVTLAADATVVPRYVAIFTAAPNPAPLVTALTGGAHQTGDLVERQVVANDPSGLALTYKASGLPKGLALHSTTGRIYGKLSTPGTYASTVTVSNGSKSSQISVSWTVTNDPSTLGAPS